MFNKPVQTQHQKLYDKAPTYKTPARDLDQGSLLGCILQEIRVAADLIKKILAFPLFSLNLKGLSFYFEGLTYVYMLLTFSFQCHFIFILIKILAQKVELAVKNGGKPRAEKKKLRECCCISP